MARKDFSRSVALRQLVPRVRFLALFLSLFLSPWAVQATMAQESAPTNSNASGGSEPSIAGTHERLREALASREKSATEVDTVESLLAEDGELSHRIERLGEAMRGAASRPWELGALQQRLASLIRQREHKALRGGVDSYRLDSEVHWELEFLRERFQRAGLASESLPSNEFELLDKPTLRDLTERYIQKLQHLDRLVATRPALWLASAIEQGARKLQQMKEALERPGVDLAARFYKNLPRPKSDADRLWAEHKLRSRSQNLQAEERRQLELAMAKDGYDPAVALRFQDLEELAELSDAPLKTPRESENYLAKRRTLAMQRAAGFRPPARSSRLVANMLKDRFQDPLRAIAAEAVLRIQHHELSELRDIKIKKNLLPGPLESSFPDWVATHLSDGDLIEVKSYLEDSQAWWQKLDTQVPIEIQSRRDIDKKVVQEELAAVQREIDYRQVHGKSRLPEVKVQSQPAVARGLLYRHARMSVTHTLSTKAGKQAHYEALQAYAARSHPTAEAPRLIDELYLDGMAIEMDGLEKDTKRLDKLLTDYANRSFVFFLLRSSDVGNEYSNLARTKALKSFHDNLNNSLTPGPETLRAIDQTQTTLQSRGQLIRAGLTSQTGSSEKKNALITRLDRIESLLKPTGFALRQNSHLIEPGATEKPVDKKSQAAELDGIPVWATADHPRMLLDKALASRDLALSQIGAKPISPPMAYSDPQLAALRERNQIELGQFEHISAQVQKREHLQAPYKPMLLDPEVLSRFKDAMLIPNLHQQTPLELIGRPIESGVKDIRKSGMEERRESGMEERRESAVRELELIERKAQNQHSLRMEHRFRR